MTFIILIQTVQFEDSGVLRYGAVELGEFFLKFQLRLVPPSSRVKQFKKNSRKTHSTESTHRRIQMVLMALASKVNQPGGEADNTFRSVTVRCFHSVMNN